MFDLVIENARLRRREGVWSLGISGSSISAITHEPLSGTDVVDAHGALVTESYVDCHLHLCKVKTLDMVGHGPLQAYARGSMGKAMSAIELAAAVKDSYDESWIYENARDVVLAGLSFGVTHVLAFADTDTRARLEGIKALLRVREELRHCVDIRVVAFPQDGLLRDEGARDYIVEALELGADVVGGIPWIEYTDRDSARHVAEVFDLAQRYDRDVAMLVDDAGDPSLRTTQMLGEAALDRGWVNRVTACHARAMNLYPDPYFHRLAGLAKRAGMGFVSDPHTGPLHLRLFDLLDAGVPVALGQDDVCDAYYPYGRHNMLEVAFLASHIVGALSPERMEHLYDMITTLGGIVLHLPDHRLEQGAEANLVVLGAATIRDALTHHEAPRYVVSRGRIVARTRTESELLI